jgi:hypothetical protein
MKHDEPILITGAARSGTSLTAGIIHSCDVFGGDMFGDNKYNKKGMFENKALRQELVKPYLNSIGADTMGQNPLPDQKLVQCVPGLHDAVIYSLMKQGLKTNQRWFYKGAKLCLVWKPWDYAFPKAKWIIVRRPDEQIISSCMRTPFMRKRATESAWAEWLEYHKERWLEMQEKLDCREIWSDKLIAGDLTELKDVLAWLGLSCDESKIFAFIDPMLYNRTK